MLRVECPTATRFKENVYRKSWEYIHYESTFYLKRCEYNIPDFNPTNILDIGACIGSLCLYASAKHPEARVIAVEPDVINYGFLSKNIRHNNLSVECLRRAVTKKSDTVRVLYKIDSNFGQNSLHYRTDKDLDSIKVKTIGFKDLVDMFDGNVSFCKIDIEGGEYEFIDEDCTDSLLRIELLDIDIHPVTDNYFSEDEETKYKDRPNAYYDLQKFLLSIGFRRVYKEDHRLWWNSNIIKELVWKGADICFCSMDEMIFYRKMIGDY